MRVDLDIDELVLDGLNPQNHPRVREAIESELGRLISQEGDPPPSLCRDREIGYLDAGTSGATGKAVGFRVARTLYGALRR